ncbi:MAG: hypothetical protein U1E25_11330 [Methylocystis sp.]
MTLHELCANVVAHGALSKPGGRVAVDWTIDPDRRTPMLRFVWREHGGAARVAAEKEVDSACD